MGSPISNPLMGRGTLPDDVREQLDVEPPLVLEEGVRGSITYRHHRAHRRRSSLRREMIRAALLVTRERLAVYVRARPFVHVPFGDRRFAALEIDVVEGGLSIAFDAGTFDERSSGRIEVLLRVAEPGQARAQIRSRSGGDDEVPWTTHVGDT